MTSTLSGGVLERRDVPLNEAFEVVTNGAILSPNALQQALFPRLLTQDTGLLIPTCPGAGKLEAIFIPSVVGMRTAEIAHRLFIIGPDGAPLDDYSYRLGPYLQCLVIADEAPRTIWFEEPERSPIARTYQPDGSVINGAAHHPFSENVDVIVMPFSHFRSLFFDSGGVHGVPEGIGFDLEAAQAMAPRGLFYFDDSFGPSRAAQSEFIQLVEFLYAQDLDVVVGTSVMPPSMREDLSFLDTLSIQKLQRRPDLLLQFTQTSAGDMIGEMARTARRACTGGARVAVALNEPADGRIDDLARAIAAEGVQDAYLYRTRDSRSQRGKIYAELMARQRGGRDYLVVADGPAIEVSDFDLSYLISEPCRPLSLLKRSGRVNRHGSDPDAMLHIVGDPSASLAPATRLDPDDPQCIEELEKAVAPVRFDVERWQDFCV